MKIGAPAGSTGTPVETIRYYERYGLAQLQVLEKQLRRLRTQCRKVEASANCGILGALSKRVPPNPQAGPAVIAHPRGSHRMGSA